VKVTRDVRAGRITHDEAERRHDQLMQERTDLFTFACVLVFVAPFVAAFALHALVVFVLVRARILL
jgi:hypothetical protein